MLAFLRGTVLMIRETSLVLDVHDIGYAVFSPASLLMLHKVGDRVELFVHHHVREGGIELYGFASQDELELFEKLISVSGVGPKTALAALSAASANGIIDAISRGDAALLRSVAGIGAKTAERIMVELRANFANHVSVSGKEQARDDREILDALLQLGYPMHEAREAIRGISADCTTVESRLFSALKILGK